MFPARRGQDFTTVTSGRNGLPAPRHFMMRVIVWSFRRNTVGAGYNLALY
jgi:hypothetical protein